MTKLAFVDTETTGLDPMHHEIWEVGLILRDDEGVEVEYEWQLPVDLGKADPIALNIGRFPERRWPSAIDVGSIENHRRALNGQWGDSELLRCRLSDQDLRSWATQFVALTYGAHLVGAVVSFDEERLRRLLRRNHQCQMWHYHVVDVEALAAGHLGGMRNVVHEAGLTTDDDSYGRAVVDTAALAAPPWRSEDLSRAVDVDPDQFDRHTALGDARWAMAIYDAVIGTKSDA